MRTRWIGPSPFSNNVKWKVTDKNDNILIGINTNWLSLDRENCIRERDNIYVCSDDKKYKLVVTSDSDGFYYHLHRRQTTTISFD
jgi:hypothetical protein